MDIQAPHPAHGVRTERARGTRRRAMSRAAALLAAGTSVTLPAACAPPGPGTPASDPRAGQPAGGAPATAAPAGQPRPGGVTVWAAETDPVALNPITNSNFSSTQGFEHVYESLTAYDSKLNIVPALAERWDTPDDRTYIFYLRRGVKWHDGTEFTAEDVKYTFDIVLDPSGPAVWRSNFDQVERVETLDRYTVRFSTKAPFPPLLGAFAILRSSAIIQQGAMDKLKLETQAIGTGPYKLLEYVPKSHLKLARHPQYWGSPLPYIEDVTLKVLEEEDARVAALRSGAVDYAFLTPEGELRLRNDRNLQLLSGPRVFLYVFIANMLRQPWNDVRVRQAISLAVDREEMIDKTLSGAGTVSGPIATGFGDWFVPPEELKRRWYTPDLNRARQLLREAGVPDGQELDLLLTPSSPFYAAAAVVFKNQLQKIGINVKIRQVEQGVFIREASAEGGWNYDFNVNAFSPRHDPDGFLWARFYSKNPTAVGYSNEKIDGLLLTARTTVDLRARRAMYDEAQRILLDEAPMLWIAVDNVIEGLQPRLKGYTQSPFTRRDWGLKHAWLSTP
ncbi:MAG TPA: ABC transporter substrate-binding protein [Chloroflexota bacterium]|nr:ABC transporter substrate-binding protein [Chloroflexota bacterium]